MSSLSLNVYTHSGSGPSEEPSSASPTLDPERLRCVTALACDSSGGSVWKSFAGEVEVRHRVELAELPRALLEAAPAEIDLEEDDDDDEEEVGRGTRG